MSPPRRHPALDAWGEYDRDDPFAFRAGARRRTRARGQAGRRARGVAGRGPRRSRGGAGRPALSKDMHAAQARSEEVVADGLPGPALARHMLVVDPPDHTRLRRQASPAFSKRRVAALETRGPVGRRPAARRPAARGGADRPVDLMAGYAFPLPFYSDQRAARDPGAGSGRSRHSRFGQLPGDLIDYTPTEPLLVVEVDADVCFEQHR
jgi:cytochrome P450